MTRDGRRDAAEGWFLERGLPAVVTVRARSRSLGPRSAPALAAHATVVVALLVVFLLTGSSEVYVDGAPTPAERIVLAVIALAVPLAVSVGRAVSRVLGRRAQSVVGVGAVAVAVVAGVVQGGASHLLGTSDGTVLGMTIPVPQSLIHMALILCALTFMYVGARTVGDDDYKRDFLNPLIEDLHTTLIARNRYRTELAEDG